MQAATTSHFDSACEDLIGRMTMPGCALQTGRAWSDVGDVDSQ